MIGLLAAIFLPWLSGEVHIPWYSLTGLMTTSNIDAYSHNLPMGGQILVLGIMFLCGAVISFITPLGGALQIAGCAIFYSEASPYLGYLLNRPKGFLYTPYFLDNGFWICLAAGILCLLSIIIPIGLNRPWKNLSLKERLLTLHNVQCEFCLGWIKKKP